MDSNPYPAPAYWIADQRPNQLTTQELKRLGEQKPLFYGTGLFKFEDNSTELINRDTNMASREPVDIDPIDCDEMGEEDDEWDDNLMNKLEERFKKLKEFNATLGPSSDKDVEYDITIDKLKLKKDMIELVANEICDKIIKLLNKTRKRSVIRGGVNIEEPIVNYDGNLTLVRKNEVIGLGNISEGIDSP